MSILSIGEHLLGLKQQLSALNGKVEQAHAVFNQVIGARDQVVAVIAALENPKPANDDKPDLPPAA